MGPSSELCGTLPVTHHKTRPDVHTYSIVYWHTFISVKTNQKLSRVTEQINKKTDTTQCQISTQAVGHKDSTISSLQPNNVCLFFEHHMILLCGVYIMSYVPFLLLFCLYTLSNTFKSPAFQWTTEFSDSEMVFKV